MAGSSLEHAYLVHRTLKNAPKKSVEKQSGGLVDFVRAKTRAAVRAVAGSKPGQFARAHRGKLATAGVAGLALTGCAFDVDTSNLSFVNPDADAMFDQNNPDDRSRTGDIGVDDWNIDDYLEVRDIRDARDGHDGYDAGKDVKDGLDGYDGYDAGDSHDVGDAHDVGDGQDGYDGAETELDVEPELDIDGTAETEVVDPCEGVQCKGDQCNVSVCIDGECATSPVPNGIPCGDGNNCTEGDQCKDGACESGPEKDCNDNNPCTDDDCGADGNCENAPNTDPCGDGDACTVGDQCADGACIPGPEKDCNDNNDCTDDSCGADGNCENTPNNNDCDDSNACTEGDQCADGSCQPGTAVDCNDKNPCTDDSCAPAEGCKNTPNDAECGDGDLCTQGDKCADGACQPGTEKDCDDNNDCTDDACGAGGDCENTPNNNDCEDGDACTVGDQCAAGACESGPEKDCNDNNPCTDDSCGVDGNCENAPNTSPCGDGDACTVGDQCADGACIPGGPKDCDDDKDCTVDVCVNGGCGHTPIDQLCPKTEDCGEPYCDTETGCENAPLTGTDCEDGDGCSVNDKCDNGACEAGGPKDCDDNVECTDDSCQSPDGTCEHSTNDANCPDDGDQCTIEQCDADQDCIAPQFDCGDGKACMLNKLCAATCNDGTSTIQWVFKNTVSQGATKPTIGKWHKSDGSVVDLPGSGVSTNLYLTTSCADKFSYVELACKETCYGLVAEANGKAQPFTYQSYQEWQNVVVPPTSNGTTTPYIQPFNAVKKALITVPFSSN